jgi:hypothetical protein
MQLKVYDSDSDDDEVCLSEAHHAEQSGEPAHVINATGNAARVAIPQPATGDLGVPDEGMGLIG